MSRCAAFVAVVGGRLVAALLGVSLVGLLVALLAASPAFAEGGGGHGDASGGSHAMELVWQAVNLVILLAVLVFFARKPIQTFFAERRQQIGTDLDDAAKLLEKAEARYAEWQRKLIDLDSELEQIKTDSHRRAQDDRELILAEAQASAERIHKNAVATIEQELRRAQAELRQEAALLATEIAERILSEKIEQGDRDRLVDEFITRVEPNGSPSAR